MISVSNNYQALIQKLDEFIRKYYKNQLIRGLIYAVSAFLIFYLVIATLEYFGRFSTGVRTGLFWTFIALNSYFLIRFICIPLLKLYHFGKVISHEQAADIIGKHFSNVSDKLFNTLQLKKLSEHDNSELLHASVNQKIKELQPVPFSNAIDLSRNKKYVKYAAAPLLVFVVLLFAAPSFIKDSTKRIIEHGTYFEKPAPFQFSILNKDLKAVQQEDFILNVEMQGKEIPENIYIKIGSNQFKLDKENNISFNYTFKNVQGNTPFELTADGFSSKEFELKAIPNPIIMNFDLSLNYPAYLNKKPESLKNTGDLLVPAGTKIMWHFTTRNTDKVSFFFNDTVFNTVRKGDDDFQFARSVKNNMQYSVKSANEFMTGKDSMTYTINVIQDAYPTIAVQSQQDSFSTRQLYFRGNINDDYGFTRLAFAYRYLKSGNDSLKHSDQTVYQNITFNRGVNSDQFFYYLNMNEIKVNPGDEVEYFFEVWDNDGVNGAKSARSQSQIFKAPTLEEMAQARDKNSSEMKDELKETIKDAKELQKETNETLKRLTEKKNLEYEDKKKIENLIKKQDELQQKVEDIKKQNELNNKTENELKQQDQRIAEKQQQLQELFDKVMSEEMKKKMDELQKLMQQFDKEKMKEMLEQMKMDSKDLEKELDRNLELFKQLELEQKMNDAANRLEELSKEQEKLAEKAEEKNADSKELEKQQEELNKKFDELKKELEDAEKKNNELESPMELPDTKEEQKNIDKEMNNSSEELKKSNKKGAQKSQKKSAEQMQQMAEKIKKGMEQQEQEQAEEDMNALRLLLENLIRFSFNQEKLMADLKGMDVNNPKYIQLSQQQRKLKDDAKVIEDSLFELSKRVVQIQSIVNQEIGKVNSNSEKAIDQLQERNLPLARSSQQYVMTSVNNLALMLSEALQQMQQEMNSKMSNSSCSKPGKGKPSKSASQMSKMQKDINNQLQKMKDGMKPGPGEQKKPGQGQQGMSEQLAKLAAQQQALRQALQEWQAGQEQQGKNGKEGSMGDAIKKMEETEKDIVNKKISEETLKRQNEIMVRLLEAEKAEREQDEEEKRESNQPKQENFLRNPAQFEQFKKQMTRETELLKTVPPQLNTFYRNLVNSYFQGNTIER